MTKDSSTSPILGLRANAAQFALLVAVNALVGGMLGQERTVVPLLAEQTFGLSGYSAALSFIVVFGFAKALTNAGAGSLADRYGRRPVLVTGWVVALPVPLVLLWAPSWAWVLGANALLGVSQGLTWSTTVIMKIDLVGPSRRGLAMGLNEAAGYVAVALTASLTGLLAEAHGLRPTPFLVGLAYAALGWACPRQSSARPTVTSRLKSPSTRRWTPRPDAHCSRGRASPTRPWRRPARQGW